MSNNYDYLSDKDDHRVLVIDDIFDNLQILKTFLKAKKYQVFTAQDGLKGIELCRAHKPHLILLDLAMHDMDGMQVLMQIRKMPEMKHTGVIMVTAETSIDDILECFQHGADDFVRKPYAYQELLARMHAVLRARDLQKQLDCLNQKLDEKVQEQVEEIGKSQILRRFMSPHVIKHLMSLDPDAKLRSEKREITVAFLDYRKFTPFANNEKPENIINFLQSIYEAIGPIIFTHNATIERFTGDGLMCILNAPNQIDNHAQEALSMSKAMLLAAQEAMKKLKIPPDLQPAMGIATGLATTGPIGFSERTDYAAIGPVTNLAARLCARAEGFEILIASSTKNLLDDSSPLNYKGDLELKGFHTKEAVYSISI